MSISLKSMVDGYLSEVGDLDFRYSEMDRELSKYGVSMSEIQSEHRKGRTFYNSVVLWVGSAENAVQNKEAIQLSWVGDDMGNNNKPSVTEFAPDISYVLRREFAGMVMSEEVFASDCKPVIISSDHLNHLQYRSELLDWLEAKGVDNWSGYCTPPDREDYETEEEYEKAYEDALGY